MVGGCRATYSVRHIPRRCPGSSTGGVITQPRTIVDLVAEGTLDAELAALLWLLVEGGIPLIVSGDAEEERRRGVATALLAAPPAVSVALVDADHEPVSADVLGAHLQAGTRLGLTLRAPDLRAAIELLTRPPRSLADDAVRRLGIVVVLDAHPASAAMAVHYLRPTERDAQGHLQRRPPAVLATWHPASSAFDHFEWGVISELADRVDRSQADLERRQASRAAFLEHLAHTDRASPSLRDRLAAHVAGEPPREPAPTREPARPSPLGPPPGGPHIH